MQQNARKVRAGASREVEQRENTRALHDVTFTLPPVSLGELARGLQLHLDALRVSLLLQCARFVNASSSDRGEAQTLPATQRLLRNITTNTR